MEGEGVSENFERARDWFIKGAAQGHAESQCRLGTLYALGGPFPQDHELACELLSKAAAQGLPNALFALDVLYPDEVNGPHVPVEVVPKVEEFVQKWVEKLGLEDAGY